MKALRGSTLANAFQMNTENKVQRIRSSIRTNDKLVLSLTPMIWIVIGYLSR